MDERTLNDLLECSVCLERLDTSSKVLPCQHTFCKKCLEVIIRSHHKLRCPECRVLVDIKIDDLPPNVLLMRILEGMKSTNQKQHNDIIQNLQNTQQTEKPEKNSLNKRSPINLSQINQQLQQQKNIQPEITNQVLQQRQNIQCSQITLAQFQQKRLLPHAIALYDFKSKETFDLSFKKGDIIFVKRKIDANWFYGELNGQNNTTKKEGTFPINYVKIMIGLPQPQCIALYDFKMGPSEEEGCLAFKKGTLISVLRRVDENWAEGRIANSIGIFPIAFAEMNPLAKKLLQEKSTESNNTLTIPLISNARALPPVPIDKNINNGGESTNSSSSTVTSPNSTCSSSSNSVPSSPSHGQIVVGKQSSNSENCVEYRNTNSTSQKEKRNSLNSLHQGNLNLIPTIQLNRHSAEILSIPDVNEQQPSGSSETLSTNNSGQGIVSQKSRVNVLKSRNGTGQQNVPQSLPWAYMALYPYKPKKSDELELKKGCVYFVTERCLDGWFKGKNWQDKSGVFPGNYVTPLRNRDHQQLMHQRKHSHGSNIQIRTAENAVLSSISDQSPDLPPRGTGANTSSTSSVWNNVESLFGRKSHNSELNQKAAGTSANGKEKCESSVGGLMKRFTNINKNSKSPVANVQSKNSNYSADNPVFEDCALLSLTQQIKNSSHPVHVRSGSCPSQLLQELPADLISHGKIGKSTTLQVGSQRLKVKERPSLNIRETPSSFTSSSSCVSGNNQGTNHRKTQSFDANSMSQSLQNSKTQIPKEGTRFRCIVSYPPNSEFELELNVGDIVYVQRKQKNGWYKGTKDGKIGLFPASFVEPDL